MSNSPPVVEGNLSHDRMVLLDISKLPEEFKQPGALPPRQHACPDVPRIFDWCYRLQKDTGNIGNGGLTWVTWPPPAGNQSNLASDSSGPAAAENSSLDFADDNVFNNQLFASCHQSSDNEDDWDAMAATPCGGSCNLAPDYDSENCLAAAPATPAGTGTAANEIVPTSKSASSDEYPHDFVELAHDVLAAATTCPETAVPTSGLSDNIVCPNSAVDVGQLQQLVAEAADVSTEAAPDLRRKRQRKVVAQVGSTSNPGMDYGARRRNRG
jgi:hypothetical protein